MQRLNAARGEIIETDDIAVSGQKRVSAGNFDTCGKSLFEYAPDPSDGV